MKTQFTLIIELKIVLLLLSSIFLLANYSLAQTPRELPQRLFGLTLDDVSNEQRIFEELESYKREFPEFPSPVIRVIFDVEKTKAKDYVDFLREIRQRKLAFVMGEIMDSQYIHFCQKKSSPENCYLERTKKYFEKLGEFVDLWEIGNELNGEWTGWKEEEWQSSAVTARDMENVRDSVARQVAEAYRFLHTRGKKTAITFYFNDDDAGRHSWEDTTKKASKTNNAPTQFGKNHSMLTWAEKYKNLFPELDYVFISYYEDDNFAKEQETNHRTPIVPTFSQWADIFKKLNGFYHPKSGFGFGEVAPQCRYRLLGKSCIPREDDEIWKMLPAKEKGDRSCPCCISAQPIYINRYYIDWDAGIRQELKGAELENHYVGGYFYWYFNDDVVTNRNPQTTAALKTAFGSWYKK